MSKENDPYIVSKATCGGCKYFRYLSGEFMLACHYTYDTGKLKPLNMKCSECTFKEKKGRGKKCVTP